MLHSSDLKMVIRNLIHNPIGYPILVFNKMVIKKFKFKKGNDYDSLNYWEDRFKKYGLSVKGPGQESDSVQHNEARYSTVIKTFEDQWRMQVSETYMPKTLEIGVGTGVLQDQSCI